MTKHYEQNKREEEKDVEKEEENLPMTTTLCISATRFLFFLPFTHLFNPPVAGSLFYRR